MAKKWKFIVAYFSSNGEKGGVKGKGEGKGVKERWVRDRGKRRWEMEKCSGDGGRVYMERR
jgi:hypothetical protein